MQMSGTHLHFDEAGEHAGLHGTHLHEIDHHGDEHSAERDVPVLEQLGLIWAELLPLILACVIWLIAEHVCQQRYWRLPSQFAKPRRRSRWRPPLRAPPASP